MAQTSPDPTSTAILPLATQIIQGYADATRPAVIFLVLGTAFPAMLFPLLLALFYFSNTKSRRRPMFLMVVFIILLGLTLGMWNGALMMSSLFSPLQPPNTASLFAFQLVYSFTPWIVDFVLLLRLLAVYHPRQTSMAKLTALLAFPFAAKVARLVVLALYVRQWRQSTTGGSGSDVIASTGNALKNSIFLKADWVVEIFDNGYASFLFMWRLRGSASFSSAQNTIRQRIRTLFWIAATNFVFPVIFGIGQTITAFTTTSPFVPSYIKMVNIFFAIVSVVFATVWSSAEYRDTPRTFEPWSPRAPGNTGHLEGNTGSNAAKSAAGPTDIESLTESHWGHSKATKSKDMPLQVFVSRTHAVMEDNESM